MDGAFRDPGITAAERAVYQGSIGDEVSGRGTLELEPVEGGLDQRIDMVVADHARYAMHARFSVRSGWLLAEEYSLETFSGDKRIAREEGAFRDVQTLQWGGELRPYPRSVTPLLACATALRGLDFEKGERRSFAVWLANTLYWQVDLHIERRERVDLPAGAFDAWRIRVRPSFREIAGALDRIMGVLLPPFIIHFEAEAPHRFLRFTFPTGPFPWNPRGRIEAVEFKQMAGAGFEPAKHEARGLQPRPFDRSGTPPGASRA